jgi:hypothetical protein
MSDTPGWTSPSPEGTPEGTPPSPGWGTPPPPGAAPPPPGQNWSGSAGAAPSWGASPGGYGTPPVTKPGVIPLRPLGLGEILDGAITTMRTYPKATLGFAAFVAAVTQLLTFFAVDSLVSGARDGFATQEQVDAYQAEAVFLGLALVLLGFIGSLVLSGCLTAIIGQAVLGRPVSLGEAWSRVRPRIWALIGTALLGMLIVAGGFLLLVLPGIYFFIAFSLSTPALILENQSVTQALRRSWDLVKGSWWRIFGILLLANIIAGIVGGILELPFDFAGGGFRAIGADQARSLTTSDVAWGSFAGVVSSTITAPFVAGVAVLLYVDRRMRREGLDVTLAATAAQQAAGPQPGTGYPTA